MYILSVQCINILIMQKIYYVVHHFYCEFESRSWWGVLDTTLCDKVCHWLVAGWWFCEGIPVFSTNKTDRHDITEIVLNVALNTVTLSLPGRDRHCSHR